MNKKAAADNTESQKRLLIIDDEENMRHMLSSLLKKSGYRVDTASNGKEALEMVDQTLYDLILCDLKMPDITGMEFILTGIPVLQSQKIHGSMLHLLSHRQKEDYTLTALNQ